MAPLPQEREEGRSAEGHAASSVTLDSERVVISGMSGAYPKARHIKDLSDILYNKVNPISENELRWNYNHPEVPHHVGLIPELATFDAQFFKVHYQLGFNMDPMSRKVLEHVYQAIFDAGINPIKLSGKKVGVYIGTCLSETEKAVFYTATTAKSGLGIAGCNKSMFANRVSYWLNTKGPSLAIDAACCSSTVALEQAHQAVLRGDCEAAIVGGCHLCLHPQTSIHFGRNLTLCKDGKTRSYDQEANGCVRSEAVNVLFLQKAKDALRIYADVVNVKTRYNSMNNTGSFKRGPEEITGFLKKFYDDIKISPSEVEYVEGFGAADFDIDKMELEAIDKVFCPGRTEPLYVGSVMSNLGYCESASGVAAITKVLLGYHTGQLAGNLHCSRPRDDVDALREGRIRILNDHMPIKRNINYISYISVNGLSITGINSHVLLKGYYKPKDLNKYSCDIPRLVLVSGRTDTAVQNLVDNLKSRPIDAEELALFHNIHSTKIHGHLGRGFTILDTDKELKTVSLCEKAEYFDSSEQPQLWFVYSGMGSQWAGMGAQLMRIPIFAKAIERCRLALEPKGIDIVHIITSPDKTIYDNILHSFVGIAAVQIGLTDVLLEMGLIPDKIIGHSVGELGCAYADGCLTAEEMILAAYSRGLVSIKTPFIRGSMAAIGIGFEEISKICPSEIEVACHNSSDSSTISGPAQIMTDFVAQLTAKGIFAKEVPCSNIAYHSRYIAEAGPELLNYLQDVIKTPKLRSERWVSTSVPRGKWDDEAAKYSSAEYHTNNLLVNNVDRITNNGDVTLRVNTDFLSSCSFTYLSPVLFEETSKLIPDGAVLVEIAPHGLLQAILKRSLPKCTNVPLTRRGHQDNVNFLLEAVGKLFMSGYYPDIRALYPKVEFPVSTGTPHLSHLVEWAHQETWFLAQFSKAERKSAASCTFKISIHDDEYNYLQGHQIRGKTVFPFASALVAAWDTLAMSLGSLRQKLPVQFRDVQLFAQPLLHDSRLLRLCVSLHRGSGWFEINDDITKVASGYISSKKFDLRHTNMKNGKSDEGIKLKTKELYDIFTERGYIYRDQYKSIREANVSFTEGKISWADNWALFLDGIMQFNALRQPHDGFSQPAFIRDIAININLHSKVAGPDDDINVTVCTEQDQTRCGGVTLTGLKFRNIIRSDENEFVFDTSNFDPKSQIGNEFNGKMKNTSQIVKVLKGTKVGDVESLHWVEAPVSSSMRDDILVKVHYAGLNGSDVLKANGQLPFEDQYYASESYYGMDFSGVTESGERVMGVVRGGAASTVLRAAPELLWPAPAHWSLEDAATVPFPYAHAYYLLSIRTRLMRRSKILVSGGAGATGQAIISMALHLECRVFVVVGDARKKRFLIKMFPELNPDDIICCRDDTFINHVLPATKGRGCEYVVCGRGDLKHAYINCCAPSGYTLDIHQVKNNENFEFRMSYLSCERCYVRVDFSALFLHQKTDICKELQRLVAEGISGGAVRPLSRVCYASGDAARAFRLLAAGGHRGRVLLRMFTPLDAELRIWCSAEKSQLLISDDEGLAVHLADRLVQRGARTLLMLIPNTTARLSLAKESWQKSGANVVISSENYENPDCASNLMTQSLRLGPVEGIFMTSTRPFNYNTQVIYKSLVAKLDAEARKRCPSIKYFAVTGINNSIGARVCSSRAADSLPAMMLVIPWETKVEDRNSTNSLQMSYIDIVNATEKGLHTKQPLIVAQRPVSVQRSFSQQIAEISDVTISENGYSTQTLQDLGITLDRAQTVSIFLRNKHNIEISEDAVKDLTIEKILKLQTTLKESDYTEVKGLSAFFKYVDSDELLATVETVLLPTLTISSDMRDDEFVASEPCLYILPGLQGHHQRYQALCERLKLAAMVLQPGLDNPNESIQELTAKYTKTFLKKGAGAFKFYLLGHELGLLSVFEMAAKLEDQGLTGTVFCLGGGPEEFLSELERQLSAACAGAADAEQALQEAVARHMCALMGITSPELDANLRDAPTWEAKVETSVRTLRGRVAYSAQYVRLLIETAYARVTQARRHTLVSAPRALHARVVLLRSPAPLAPPAPAPHPLQRYSLQPLIVHDLRAPFSRATDDLRVAAIINRYLDDEALQCFDKKNLCHTFLMNSDTFISNPDVA